MKKTYASLLAISLYLGSMNALPAVEFEPPLATLQITMADHPTSALTLRLSLLEALRHLHWETTMVERDKLLASYDGRSIELDVADNQSVTITELANDNGKRLKRDWLPNLQKILIDYVEYNNNVARMKSYYPADQ